MKYLNWIKTAGGALFTGLAGWKVYAAMAVLTLALLAGVALWFNHRIDAAFEAGQKAVTTEQLKGEVDTLRSLSDANKESSDAIAKNLEALGGMSSRVDELDRLRSADRASFERRLRAATPAAVSAYAGQAERDIAAVESSRDGFARDALQASTAAWGYDDTLRARREAISRDGIDKYRSTLRTNPKETTP